jgi:hypothetical protein
MNDAKRFHVSVPHDPDSSVTVALRSDGSLTLSVSEEQAVDSYNQYFSCDFTLTDQQAMELRDFLCRLYPTPSSPKGRAQVD